MVKKSYKFYPIFKKFGRKETSVNLFSDVKYLVKTSFFEKSFFFLAIPKTCISMLWVMKHNQVWGSI